VAGYKTYTNQYLVYILIMQRQRKKPEKNNPIQNSFKEYLGINLTR
jgi:hypothetical protein